MNTVKKQLNKEIKKIQVSIIIDGKSKELKNTKIVFKHAIDSVNKFYELFQNRNGTRGSTTHADQDLLRAMLVFSCSGLDAVIKQLIKDTLPKVLDKDPGAQQEFQKFIERKMKKGGAEEREKLVIDMNWIASIFANATPRIYLIKELQKQLLKDSLQSREQLLKIATHFAISQTDVLHEAETTNKAFEVRNEIIHEMDTNLSGQKKRKQRKSIHMVKFCENILEVGRYFIDTVQKKIDNSTKH